VTGERRHKIAENTTPASSDKLCRINEYLHWYKYPDDHQIQQNAM